MKKILFIILLLALSSSAFSLDYELNKIRLKLKTNYLRDISNNKIPDIIPELKAVIGNHSIKPFIRTELIINIHRKQNADIFLSQTNEIGLDRIIDVEYEGKIDPFYASSKLKTLDFIDFAEPIYIRQISDLEEPNDTLFAYQYYLKSINAIAGWKHIDTNNKVVVIGVVDTGVDYYHIELSDNMYVNPGEDGNDENGNDKRSNGIDDDKNGFVDDWRGWDFGSSSQEGEDNDAKPGNGHGTHVAGIIAATKNNIAGIAGISLNAKILPVKIGNDDPNSRGLTNSYEGLLYAAIAGSNIINCSWGGGGYSQSEQDVINQVNLIGSVIVAAAGNDYSQTNFYPASYDGVLSVAAIDSSDRKANFSNYSSSVDVSAPGVDIISTIPGNDYATWSGTSMASPVVAAVAGMVWINYPEYISIQVGEHIKATSEDINWKNPFYTGTIGTGKVDAFKASTETNPISIIMKKYLVREERDDEVIESGERIDISLDLFNALKPVKGVTISARSESKYKPIFINDSLFAGDFNTLELKSVPNTISFIIPDSVPYNYLLPITIEINCSDGKKFLNTISIFVNPTWRTMRQNNIHLTFTSQGNLAYDDFPNNNRGAGFSYRGSQNLLFEGALMVGYAYNRLSNVARGSSGSASNRDFAIVKSIVSSVPGKNADEETYAEFKSQDDSTNANVVVLQTGYQSRSNIENEYILVTYDIINNSGEYRDSVFAALYMDWDIGPSGSNNIAIWNKSKEYAFVQNSGVDALPIVGMKLLSNQQVNFWAIDNDGDTLTNPGVYDGFTKEEKWQMMTGKIGRDTSSKTDVSLVFGAGPISMRANDTARVSFALFASNSVEMLDKIADNTVLNPKIKINPDGSFATSPSSSEISLVFPNPAQSEVTIELFMADKTIGELTLWDLNGKLIATLFSEKGSKQARHYPGIERFNYNLNHLAQGQYILRYKTNSFNSTAILNIIK